MFFILSKLLKVFIFPITWIIGLLIIAYFVKNKQKRRVIFIISCILLVVFTNKPILNHFQYALTKNYAKTNDPQKHYRVAVVMGGFGHMNTQTNQLCYFQDRGARIWEPIRLWECGIVDKILVSGDQTIELNKDGETTADHFLHYMHQVGIPDTCWILEQQARNTQENATYSIAILDSLGYQADDCLLVTSASHMKRAYNCFLDEGWSMSTYAVNIYSKPGRLRFQDILPSWQTLIDWNELFNEWVGVIVYKIVGY